MAKIHFINRSSKVNNDTGFGSTANYGGRFINRDGSFNIRKEGQNFWKRVSVFHIMLNLPSLQFFVVLLMAFIGINVLFTVSYLFCGISQFQGIIATTNWEIAKELFFFSAQTFTTVGYGRINPIGGVANLISSFEAMSGFISFAVVTGLVYGRISKPKAYLIFSDHALISPFRGGLGLMFRFASYKEKHTLTGVEIQVTVALKIQDNGEASYKFYDLELERKKVDNLPMNWTVVHPIDDNSPLKGFSEEDFINADTELYVTVRGFDDVFSNYVLTRTSYTYDEIKFNRKFLPMYRESGNTTILELNKLHEHSEV